MKKFIYFLIFVLTLTNNANAWWNCSWLSMIPITITNTGTAQSNYVVEIHFTSANVSNYIWTNQDKDLRFIDSDNTTSLKFFAMPRASATQEVLAWISIPSVPVGTKTIYMYYNNATATSVSSPTGVLVSGVRMYTKGTSASTTLSTYSSWWSAFNAAAASQTGYGCKILTDMTSVNNSGQFGSAANILFSYVTVLTANSSGSWQFRHGPDYGFGGGIYANDVVLQEKYGTDLWWNNSWANAAQILTGSFNATNNAYYVLRSYGGENSADGLTQLQIANPSGTFNVMSTGNYTLNAPPCEAPTVNKIINSPQVTVPIVTKTVVPYSDPINGTTNPKLIPGGRARYTINISSDGGGGIDNNSIVISDLIPANTKMYVSDLGATGSGPVLFVDGTPSSNLSYSKTNLTYSNNNGVSYAYSPTPDAQNSDINVTNIKLNPTGSFSCSNGTTKPNFNFIFDVIVK